MGNSVEGGTGSRRPVIQAVNKSLAPARVAQPPAERVLGFGVGRAPDASQHRNAGLTCSEPPDHEWHLSRRLRADDAGQVGQPDRDGRWFVINDVVDTAPAFSEGSHRCPRGIVDMYERPDTATITDNWEAPPVNCLEMLTSFANGCTGPVEAP